MDAIRIARAQTGRDTIVKIFGSYHGHHDYVMVSIGVPHHQIGNRENYASIPYGAGIPKAVGRADRSRFRSTTRARWSGGSSRSSRKGARPPA